jgi:hypothetical protein
MRVIAYPNRHYPPAADVLALADIIVRRLDDVRPSRWSAVDSAGDPHTI